MHGIALNLTGAAAFAALWTTIMLYLLT